MPAQNTSELKEKIIGIFRMKGPRLPVHIAKETGMNILFSSAFLSELVDEKRIKVSNMKVGSSPLYFIPGQEFMLERFSEYLKSKEREAFILLKEKKFLKDSEQEPAIRVALRSLKDFAVPFKYPNESGDIYWRYFTVSISTFEIKKEPINEKPMISEEEISKPKKPLIQIREKTKTLEIFDKKTSVVSEPKAKTEKKIKEKTLKKKTTSKKSKQNDKFLEKIKDFLSKSAIEITSIEGLGKDEIVLKVKNNGEEQLLMAFNKKKITEKEIIKAAKKAAELNLKYSILSMSELPKKVSDLIYALKDIKTVEKVE
ncbi:hypothetical protein J4407_00920 [Candidatus Pacearchaeota archaeon]|nr:hypothetical protein [Candidatus Pacearchaeota archaeon]